MSKKLNENSYPNNLVAKYKQEIEGKNTGFFFFKSLIELTGWWDECAYWTLYIFSSLKSSLILLYSNPVLCFFAVATFFFKIIYLRERKSTSMGWGRSRGEGERVLSRLCTEQGVQIGVHLTVLRSGPEAKPRVLCSIDSATQAPAKSYDVIERDVV